ncbi:hypothetical protein FRZ67_20195 [Panacibacter ginsenosidivorans]|uniref:Asl1-like glycosyl hydrolase catalytic domain-containing protein n=1 Tax=Panacibacter ginsenosidivorans TaxID=1813871 RepID=A0A5B8VGS1_9BACT|nr:hypothetical protein [Panacibacter ginsenosidivorans]QEC69508.1 hypothetical protein FRZ67_20195 [Panacibacter ginsenosidivorans]
MKRTIHTLLVFLWIAAVVSCKKEAAPAINENTIASTLSSDDVVASTRFGVLANSVEGDDRITVAQELGVSYVRDAVILQYYNGKAPMLDKYQSNGFKILLNLNYSAQKPAAFPTDMVNYRILVDSVLNKYTPEVAVIENEPANDGYYSSPIEDYFTELSNAITVCHAHSVKVADGALHTGMVCILVYQDYVSRGLQAKADDFASRALNNNYLRTAQGKGSADMNAKLDKCKKMIAAYKKMDLDYVNIHWYEPLNENNDPAISAPGVAKEVAAFLIKSTGKQVLTNEFGQTNQLPTLVASQVNEFKLAHLAYAIDFSGTSGGGIGSLPLTDGTVLLPNGIAYRDAVSQ